MRRREQNASNEDDDILTVRKDGQSVSERLRSCCNSFAEFSGCLQARRDRGRSPL